MNKSNFQYLPKITVKKKRTVPLRTLQSSKKHWKIFDKSVMVFKGDSKTPLGILLKGVIKDPKMIEAGRTLNKFVLPTRLRTNVAPRTLRYNYRKDGIKHTKVVLSGIVGYSDPSLFHPCRQTYLYKRQTELFDKKVLKLIQFISKLFKRVAPEQFNNQKKFVKSLNQNMVLDKTVYTTLTVNKNLRTMVHQDRGDYDSGLGNLAVFRDSDKATFKGGEFLLPEYEIGFNMQEGDLLFVDVHEKHCNNPLKGNGRISLVCYARTGIKEKCAGITKEQLRNPVRKKKKGEQGRVTHANTLVG